MADESEPATGGVAAEKQMKLRHAGACRICGIDLPARADAIYERDTKTVRCVECLPPTVPTEASLEDQLPVIEDADVDSGVAGLSARKEYERRKAKDEERRTSTTVVITRIGVWVIDAKRYMGRPELKIEGGLLRPRVEKLLIGRRDCTELVDGVLKQADLVRDLVGDVPVTTVLGFVEADWPMIGGAFATRGVHVLWPKRLAKLLVEVPTGAVDVAAVRESVAARFKPA